MRSSHFPDTHDISHIQFFVQAILTLSKTLCKTTNINHNLQQNITAFSFIAHSFFFKIHTAEMVNHLNDARPRKVHSHFLSTITASPLD